MRCYLTDEEAAALARLLSDTINDDRHLLIARIRLLKRIRGRIRPERSPAPLPCRSATGKSIGPTKKVAKGEILENSGLAVARPAKEQAGRLRSTEGSCAFEAKARPRRGGELRA
jgi:hypothetical protein